MGEKEKNTTSEIDKISHDKLTWTNILNPDEKAIEYLQKHFEFHQLDLDDCLSENQRPKIDEYDDYLFIVLHFPKVGTRKKSLRISELHLFVGKNFLITLHEENDVVGNIFEKCLRNKAERDEYMGKGPGFLLYMILDELFESGFPLLDNISKNISNIENEVFDEDDTQDRLKDILLSKKDIINFRRIIMPQRTIIAQLEHKNKKFLAENLEVYFDNVVDKIEKIWNTLENLQELINSLQDTNESIISHTTTNTIKLLTIFSVIMLPLTFITGFYGMNVVNLPYAQHEFATLIVGGIVVGIVVLMLGFFRYKKWL